MPQLGLIGLLVAELLYLTVRFDSQALDTAASPWLRLVAWSPHYLRIVISVAVVLLLIYGRRLWPRLMETSTSVPWSERAWWLAAHAACLAAFAGSSAVVFDVAAAEAHPAFWSIAWLVSGAATLACWVMALAPVRVTLPALGRAWSAVAVAGGLGAAAWLGGLATETLWRPLAVYTFTVVGALLSLVYPTVVSDPSKLVIGTPAFKVAVAPACSGYEGIGLVLAFLAIYLCLFRRELRFPAALALLPIGAAAIWLVNAARIALLVVIGSSGWPDIALGGFHSQAGWLAFNAVSLAIVGVLNRGRFFMKPAAEAARPEPHGADSTPAYLAPFMVVMAGAMVTGAFSAGIDWLYPVRVVAALGVLWIFRRHYSNLGWTLSWRAVAIGCVTFAIWISLVPDSGERSGLPAALESVPVHWAAAWLALRVIGYTVTVPLVEELAFRGYLTRRLIRADFDRIPVGLFTWSSFAISSVLFGALHGGYWLAGTVAGMAFALALYQRRALGDAVVAHATTNGLIVAYVLMTGRWSVWS